MLPDTKLGIYFNMMVKKQVWDIINCFTKFDPYKCLIVMALCQPKLSLINIYNSNSLQIIQ